ncbi:MAG: TolC family protein, partial [Geopsychrobacter sp.]|nr:TolC family protein [Geopsychrobacter sp.]
MKTFPVAFVFVMVLFLSSAWAEGKAVSLDSLLVEADQNNPELQAAKAQAEMVGHTVDQAVSLDDPMLGFGIINIPLDQLDAESTPMSGATLTLSQKFPFPGKLAARGEMAKEKTRWYQKAYEDARLRLRQQ